MKNKILLYTCMFFASAVYAADVPTSVRLDTDNKVREHVDPQGITGNVLVTLSSGKVIKLNDKSNALLPRLAQGFKGGAYVGFVEVELEKDQKTLKTYDTLKIDDIFLVYKITGETDNTLMAVLKSAKPFIEDWGFLGGGQYIVIKSRATHGIAMIELFSIGATLDKVAKLGEVEAYKDNLPEWAQPFADPK
jgi:hypothetical protein